MMAPSVSTSRRKAAIRAQTAAMTAAAMQAEPPSPYLLLLGLAAFVLFYGLSLAPVFFVLLSEVFTDSAKPVATGTLLALTFLGGAVIDSTFNSMLGSLGDWGTFGLLAAICLAGGASIVATPHRDSPLKHIELVAVAAGQALVVMVSEDGDIENRIISTPLGLPATALLEATNFLNARVRGRTLSQAAESVLEELKRDRAALDDAAARLIEGGIAEWSGEDPERGPSLIVRGRANLLTDPQATADLDRVRRLFDDLENKKELIQILDLAKDAQAVRIFIGSENPLFSLSGSSLIIAPYMNAERKVTGALGVIGPTRLNYARIIPVVDYTARVVGRLLDERNRRGGDGR
jgi:hypothetical protein